MSDTAPRIISFAYMRIEACGPDQPLVLAFSDADQPPGTFSQYRLAQAPACNRIFLNATRNSWYLDGIPGLGASLEDAAAALRKLVAEMRPTEIVTIGTGAGAYAAIAFGCLLGADRVLAFSPETLLMLPGSRSAAHLVGRDLGAWGDLVPHLDSRTKPRVLVISGESDIVDLYNASRLLDLPGIEVVTIPRVGHDVDRALGERSHYLPTIAAVILGKWEGPSLGEPGRMLEDIEAVAYAAQAHECLAGGRGTEAESFAAQAVARQPEWDIAHHLLGRSLLLLGRSDAAEAPLRQAAMLNPSFAAYHHHLGLALARTGQHEEALATHNKTVELRPRDSWFRHHVGLALAGLGRLAEAEAAQREALRLNPASASAAYELGLLLLRREAFGEAIAMVERAISLKPDRMFYHLQLGQMLEVRERIAEAVAVYRRAREINPADPTLLTRLTVVEARLASMSETKAAPEAKAAATSERRVEPARERKSARAAPAQASAKPVAATEPVAQAVPAAPPAPATMPPERPPASPRHPAFAEIIAILRG